MYLDYFQLKEHPFQITPDADFLFLSDAHARAKAYMDYTIRNKDGFVVITGEVGAGKTTLIGKLLSEFDDNVVVAKIFQTQLNEVEFLQAVLVEFGLQPFKASKVELMDMLTTFLIDSFLNAKQLVLIVDEAQNLSPRVLEEIRMLSGLETQKQKILHVILVGQPELNATLDSPELEQLVQRVRLRFHISALTEAETLEYIMHRLNVAGGNRRLFAEDAVPLIYRYTGGIPRLVNTLCDTAMTCAFADDLPSVTSECVQSAIDELQWVPYSERVRRAPGPPRALDGGLNGFTHEADPVFTHPRLFPVEDQLSTIAGYLEGMAGRMENIEMLLRHMVTQLERRHKKISVRLGRAELSALMQQITDLDKNRLS